MSSGTFSSFSDIEWAITAIEPLILLCKNKQKNDGGKFNKA